MAQDNKPVEPDWENLVACECFESIGRGQWAFESDEVSIERFKEIIQKYAPLPTSNYPAPMKTIKLRSYAVRLAHNHKEIFLLAPDEQTAGEVSKKLMPAGQAFDPGKGDWVLVDIQKETKP